MGELLSLAIELPRESKCDVSSGMRKPLSLIATCPLHYYIKTDKRTYLQRRKSACNRVMILSIRSVSWFHERRPAYTEGLVLEIGTEAIL